MSRAYKCSSNNLCISAFEIAREIELVVNGYSDDLVLFESMDDGKSILMCFDKYEYQLHTRYGGVGLTILVRELSPGLEISIVTYGEENDSFNKKKNYIAKLNKVIKKYGLYVNSV